MYPYELTEEIESAEFEFYNKPPAYWIDDLQAGTVQYLSGTLKEPLVEYDCEPEELQSSTFAYLAGTLKEPLVDYEYGPEDLEFQSFEFEAGDLDTVLIQYTNWELLIDDESLETASFTYIDGTLT